MTGKSWKSGACHCGAVRFEVRTSGRIHVEDCNCSICAKTGYLHLIVNGEDFRLLSGDENLAEYRFNTGTARHLFCKTCGVKSFYVPRSHPDGYSVNLRCLNRDDFDEITIEQYDGQNWEANIDGLRSKTDG